MLPSVYELIGCRKANKTADVGIEIEMEGSRLNLPPNDKWLCKGDGSLRGESMEWVLGKPIPRKDTLKALVSLTEMLKLNGARLSPSDRCGVHIHVNVQQLTVPQLLNYILSYYSIEEVLIGYCGESREGNLYCLRLKDADYPIRKLLEAKKYNDIRMLSERRNHLRYGSLNLGSIRKFGSLEFRALQTPKDLQSIETWIGFLLAVKDFSLKIEESRELIEMFSMMGPYEYLERVVGEENATVLNKTVEEVDRKLMSSIRNIQEVAFTVPLRPPQTKEEIKKLDEGTEIEWARYVLEPPPPNRRRVRIQHRGMKYLAVQGRTNYAAVMERGDAIKAERLQILYQAVRERFPPPGIDEPEEEMEWEEEEDIALLEPMEEEEQREPDVAEWRVVHDPQRNGMTMNEIRREFGLLQNGFREEE